MKYISTLIIIALILGVLNTAMIFAINNNVSNIDLSLSSLSNKLNNLVDEISSTKRELETFKSFYYPIIIKDALGRTVTINSEPMRIVSCTPSITEMLFALNLSDRIVGVDKYSDYPKLVLELKEKGLIAEVGGVTTLNCEKIASLNPDIVFIDASLQKKFVSTLEGFGLTVIALESPSIEEIMNNIYKISKITLKLEEGEKLINQIKNTINEITSKTSKVSKQKVLYLVWLEPLWTTGNGTYANELISIAGGVNIFNDKNGWFITNPEEIISRNPDVIIFSSMALPKSPEELLNYIKSIPGFSEINAVKNNRIYILTENAANAIERPGPRVTYATILLAYILHPQLFNITVPNFISNYENIIRR
jgi:iron complex transport system substrate-binding protein